MDEGVRAAGEYLRSWDQRRDDGARAASRVYLVQLSAGGTKITKKLVVVHN